MPKLYEALAEAFLAEGVDTQFVLMGDGNMHWSTAFAKLPGVHTVHVRHEHCYRSGGDSLQRSNRQGRRCLGHVRPWRDPVDDGAAGRGSRPPADGGVRRRVADQRQVLQPVHRPGAAGDGDRGALHRRA